MAGIYQDFYRHLIATGVSKTANFQLTIPLVQALANNFSGYDRTLALRCEAAELPGRQLVTNDSRTYGPTYKTPYQSLYQEITLNFLETNKFFIRNFFELWLDFIFDSVHNTLNFPDSYRLNTTLTQYDVIATNSKFDEGHSGFVPGSGVMSGASGLDQICQWNLFNAFPTAVNQMPVTWTEDGLHRVTVTLAFEWYEITKPGKPKASIAPKRATNPTQGSAVK